MYRFLALITLFCLATPSLSQHLVSPEVHKDGRVTFRLRATNADKVLLCLESAGELALQKDAQGVWSVTSKVLTPDIYVYSFRVDGRQMIDPSNPLIKYNLFNTESQVLVSGAKPLVWENDQVPHGVVHRHLYRSPPSLGRIVPSRSTRRPRTIRRSPLPIQCSISCMASAMPRMPGSALGGPT